MSVCVCASRRVGTCVGTCVGTRVGICVHECVCVCVCALYQHSSVYLCVHAHLHTGVCSCRCVHVGAHSSCMRVPHWWQKWVPSWVPLSPCSPYMTPTSSGTQGWGPQELLGRQRGASRGVASAQTPGISSCPGPRGHPGAEPWGLAGMLILCHCGFSSGHLARAW